MCLKFETNLMSKLKLGKQAKIYWLFNFSTFYKFFSTHLTNMYIKIFLIHKTVFFFRSRKNKNFSSLTLWQIDFILWWRQIFAQKKNCGQIKIAQIFKKVEKSKLNLILFWKSLAQF